LGSRTALTDLARLLAPLPPPGVLLLDGELHGPFIRQRLDSAFPLTSCYALEQLGQRTWTFQVASHGLLEELPLGTALLLCPTAQLLQKLGVDLGPGLLGHQSAPSSSPYCRTSGSRRTPGRGPRGCPTGSRASVVQIP
jgi:hypothetical protein